MQGLFLIARAELEVHVEPYSNTADRALCYTFSMRGIPHFSPEEANSAAGIWHLNRSLIVTIGLFSLLAIKLFVESLYLDA